MLLNFVTTNIKVVQIIWNIIIPKAEISSNCLKKVSAAIPKMPSTEPKARRNVISPLDETSIPAPRIAETKPSAVPPCTTYAGDFSTSRFEYLS